MFSRFHIGCNNRFVCNVNFVYPIHDGRMQILDTNPQLFFHLQQQRLIELIRNGKVEEALEFAQEELAPRGEENVMLWSFIYVCLLCLINHFCMILNTSSEKCNQPHQFFFTSKLNFGQKIFFYLPTLSY